MNKDVLVIGGGAAGIIAAIVASKNGSNVTILERNDRIGKKILATGNGRCNFTNIGLTIENFSGENPKFAYSALSQFDVYQTMGYFEDIGLTPRIFENGRVYPMSLQSSSMLDVLLLELKKWKINIEVNSFVKTIKKEKNQFIVYTGDKKFYSDRVIVATGGMAMPISGSDGNGYNILKEFGHETTKLIPGLVQLKLEGNIFKKVKGVKYPGTVRLYSEDVFISEDSGDILFTDYGISGPPILELSSLALKEYENGKNTYIEVVLIDTMTNEELISYLENRFRLMPERKLKDALIGMINKRLIVPLLKEHDLDYNKNVGNLSKKEIVDLSNILTSWLFKVVGSQGWEHAQTTSGGISTKDIDNSTMESKLVDGLYIVGELLDIEGDCGGYNLQWAWSSGYVAGLNASK